MVLVKASKRPDDYMNVITQWIFDAVLKTDSDKDIDFCICTEFVEGERKIIAYHCLSKNEIFSARFKKFMDDRAVYKCPVCVKFFGY